MDTLPGLAGVGGCGGQGEEQGGQKADRQLRLCVRVAVGCRVTLPDPPSLLSQDISTTRITVIS